MQNPLLSLKSQPSSPISPTAVFLNSLGAVSPGVTPRGGGGGRGRSNGSREGPMFRKGGDRTPDQRLGARKVYFRQRRGLPARGKGHSVRRNESSKLGTLNFRVRTAHVRENAAAAPPPRERAARRGRAARAGHQAEAVHPGPSRLRRRK